MQPSAVLPNERVTFGVRYESDVLVVVDKPARVVTQPGVGHEHDTLLNGLFARYPERLAQMGEKRGWGLLHRLDRDTSGLVAVALDRAVYDELREAFARRLVRKHYWAVCHKAPAEPAGVIRRAIAEEVKKRDKYTSEKFARIDPASGKPALTAYRTLAESDTAALLEARPVTGRLHQVRVHLASVGAGILGDARYANTRAAAAWSRVALHAWRLVLPLSSGPVDVRAPLAKDLRKLLRMHELPVPSASAKHRGDGVGGDAVGDEDPRLPEDPAPLG